jgi:hypothetical protein
MPLAFICGVLQAAAFRPPVEDAKKPDFAGIET